MNSYVTGTTIKQLREKKKMTQAELAERIGVSSKTVSKWETAKGLPDISLLQPLAQALGISVIELMNGEHITNRNISANMLRCKFYVCPICGNVIHSTGNAVVSCCGVTLPALEAEAADEAHGLKTTVWILRILRKSAGLFWIKFKMNSELNRWKILLNM